MPVLRPFRALRYNVASSDLSALLAPPYDIISPSQRRALLERHPHNAVRLELPADPDSPETQAYQVAAETVADWRRSGVLVRDAEPTVTVHRMRWPTAHGQEHSATGVFVRLKLEAFGPGAGVLPHERTMSGPKRDRYQLLEASQMNTSPVVLLAGSDAAVTGEVLERLSERPPDVEVMTDDLVLHALWIRSAKEAATTLLETMSSAPLTIADGHHRYETALAYRDARQAQSDAQGEHEADPAWDYLLALVYPADRSPPALPTHRVIRGRPCGDELLERLRPFLALERLADREALLARMAEPPAIAPGTTGTGTIGILTRDKAALLSVDRRATDPLLPVGLSEASRGLDVNALSVIIDRAYGEDAATMAADGRLWYEKDARAATQQVADELASAAYLLHGMPAAAISAVAQAAETMPHKSTYFHPKAPTGLLFNPLES